MEAIKKWFLTYPIATSGELFRILPDSLLLVSGLFAILTSSVSYLMLFIALLESVVGFHVLQNVSKLFNVTYVKPSSSTFSEMCRSGFRSATLSDVSFFGYGGLSSGFPSAALYMVSVAAAYIFNSINNQSKELEALGPQYASRFYISVFTILILLFLLGSYRIFFGCDSVGVVIMSILIGMVVGTMLLYQNLILFGPDATNLLSIPLLRSRTANGEKIYACTQRSS